MKKALIWIAAILGTLALVLAFMYWTIPAGSLPSFLPGYETGVAATHFKHGLAALIVALALLVFVWFNTGSKRT